MSQKPVAGTPNWDKYAKGTVEDLSEEQKGIMTQFLASCPKAHVEEMRFPCEPPEYFACRVLRARKFSLADALKLVETTTAWRKEINIKGLNAREAADILGVLEDELQFFYQKSYFTCRDKEGRPVYVERGGCVDVDAMFLLTNIDKLVEYHTWTNEMQMLPLFESASKAAGKPITTLMAVVDMAGMSSKLSTAVTRKYITSMIGIDSKHYPETLGRMFIINVPTIFSLAWALIAPFLDERTQKKIEIFASESAWKKRMREVVDEASLPAEFGGSNKVQVFPGSRTRKATLASGKTFATTTEVLPAGATVRFRWFSRPADLGLTVTFVPGAPGAGAGAAGATTLYSTPAHPDSEKKLQDVTVSVPAGAGAGGGHFVATWSNSAGWMGWSRELFYRWDEVVGGKVKAVGGLSSVAGAVGAGKAVTLISEAEMRVPVVAGAAEGSGSGGEVAAAGEGAPATAAQ